MDIIVILLLFLAIDKVINSVIRVIKERKKINAELEEENTNE